MWKEIDRAEPAPVAAGAADDLVNDEAAIKKHLESEQRLANAAAAAIEQVNGASPKKLIVKMIEWAALYLGAGAGASTEQLKYIESRIKTFARSATEFLDRGDFHGLAGLIGPFEGEVRQADKIGPPRPPLVPPGDTVFLFAGWKREEESGLRNILINALCGVQKGDYCVSIDAQGAQLASGRVLSRKECRENYVAPAPGGKMIGIGWPAFARAMRGEPK
jgi:hypothetical protein